MWIKFDSYSVNYNGGPCSPSKHGASIICYSAKKIVGSLRFFMNTADVVSNSYTDNIVTLSFHISQFSDVLHILQYETPLSLYYESGDGRIATYAEPTGEQEGV